VGRNYAVKSLVALTVWAVFFAQFGIAYGQTSKPLGAVVQKKTVSQPMQRSEHPYYTIFDIYKNKNNVPVIAIDEREFMSLILYKDVLQKRIVRFVEQSHLVTKFSFYAKDVKIAGKKRSASEQGCAPIKISGKQLLACVFTYTVNLQHPLFVHIGTMFRSMGNGLQWASKVISAIEFVLSMSKRAMNVFLKVVEWGVNTLAFFGIMMFSIGDPLSFLDHLNKYGGWGPKVAGLIKATIRFFVIDALGWFMNNIGNAFADKPGKTITRGIIYECSNCRP
jgi:hypothetical protein